MYLKCCVPSCRSSRRYVKLHRLPSNSQRRKKWLECIPHLRNKSLTDLANTQVCHKHFESRFVTQKSGLLMTAYPTLFLGPSGTETLKSIQNIVVPDHQYTFKKLHYDHLYAKPQDAQHSTDEDMYLNLTVPNIPQDEQNIQEMDVLSSTDDDMDLYLTFPNIPQDKQNIQEIAAPKASTSKIKNMNLNLTVPNTPQVKQNIKEMAAQHSTDEDIMDLYLTFPNTPQDKQNIQEMDMQPPTSKMKDMDLNFTVPNIPQVRQNIHEKGAPPTSKMNDKESKKAPSLHNLQILYDPDIYSIGIFVCPRQQSTIIK